MHLTKFIYLVTLCHCHFPWLSTRWKVSILVFCLGNPNNVCCFVREEIAYCYIFSSSALIIKSMMPFSIKRVPRQHNNLIYKTVPAHLVNCFLHIKWCQVLQSTGTGPQCYFDQIIYITSIHPVLSLNKYHYSVSLSTIKKASGNLIMIFSKRKLNIQIRSEARKQTRAT